MKPAVHIAILKRRYLDMLLDGRKTMESRLSITRREPFGVIAPGDVILFKQSGGPYRARAIVAEVQFFDSLTPRSVRTLRTRLNHAIRGDAAYWRAKRSARYATLITFEIVRPCATGPVLPPLAGRAWVRLPHPVARLNAA